MIDNIILYFKNLPHLINYCLRRLKKIWKWFVISLVVGIVFILGVEGILNSNHNTDVAQGQWLFRETALVVFVLIVLSIYLGYKFYHKDYIVMKSFHISAVTPIIPIAVLSFITMLILGLIITFLKPINFDISVLSLIYYLFMASIFIVVASVTFGLLLFIIQRFDMIFFIVSTMCFFLVPILFIPKTHMTILDHILMLNPIYYLVHGSAQAVVFGTVSLSNIPYHIYFITFLALMCVLNYGLVRHIAFDKYDSLSHNHSDNDSKETNKKINSEDNELFNNDENV